MLGTLEGQWCPLMETKMNKQNGWAAYMAAKEQKDGPAKKFYLIKAYGRILRAAGHDPAKLSCAQ